MSKITCRFRNNQECGTVSFDAKYDEKYYKKYRMDFFDWYGCDVSISIKDCRYIDWSDKTEFIRSGNCSISALSHKRPRRYIHDPVYFDHTSYWRKPGDKWASFCLTQPYDIKDHDKFEKIVNNGDSSHGTHKLIERFNLKYKFFPPSEKSLHYPNYTAMIFWWCPDYFDFEAYEKTLMSHEDASEFEKKLIIENRLLK